MPTKRARAAAVASLTRNVRARIDDADWDGAWAALDVLAALEPADPGVRVLRALVIAERDGDRGRHAIHRELDLFRSQMEPGDTSELPSESSSEAIALLASEARTLGMKLELPGSVPDDP